MPYSHCLVSSFIIQHSLCILFLNRRTRSSSSLMSSSAEVNATIAINALNELKKNKLLAKAAAGTSTSNMDTEVNDIS